MADTPDHVPEGLPGHGDELFIVVGPRCRRVWESRVYGYAVLGSWL